jgi:hypothetical protein
VMIATLLFAILTFPPLSAFRLAPTLRGLAADFTGF